ncbi:unnamed protein product [Phytophthora fragariaefolia]|uniref:Unnamed protein product n=1 Tax=Phytophthora fragariaefolia TaxID=1490495 RepID=A0A9W6UBQ2_9STRA|nr:unnamed protein product [Phytophthora fragariaefolia]
MNRHPPSHTELSDGLVGLVRPRAPVAHQRNEAGIVMAFRDVVTPYNTTMGTAASPTDESSGSGDAFLSHRDYSAQPLCRVEPRMAVTSSMTPNETTCSSSVKSNGMFKRIRADGITSYSKSRRREQCRVNQTRYRNKQRNTLVQLENDVVRLRQEVKSLKSRYQDLLSQERSSHSPWSIVAEVFHLLESSFRSPWSITSTEDMMIHPQTRFTIAVLERAFALDAAMGDLRGVKALVEQLRIYSQCFGGSELRLKCIETVSAGVMAARAEFSVTLTEFTLKHMLPQLEERHGRDYGDRLYKQLLDQQLECGCSLIFLFDGDTDRFMRLETVIDPVIPLFRLVGNLENVLGVMENARISPERILDNVSG